MPRLPWRGLWLFLAGGWGWVVFEKVEGEIEAGKWSVEARGVGDDEPGFGEAGVVAVVDGAPWEFALAVEIEGEDFFVDGLAMGRNG